MDIQPTAAFSTQRSWIPAAPSLLDSEPTVTDRFQPSGRTAEDRQADAALLHTCGDGCGCIRAVSGDGDPIQALEARDAEVRLHEQRHYTEAGEWAVSGPQFTFVTARNGRQYAVAGKVHVDISEIVGNAHKTLEKMDRILRSCLAPADPSAQDRHVASEAMAKRSAAQVKVQHEGTGR